MTETTDFLTRQEAAKLLGISRAFLEAMHRRNEGPPYYRPSVRRVLYRRDELLAWLETTRVQPRA